MHKEALGLVASSKSSADIISPKIENASTPETKQEEKQNPIKKITKASVSDTEDQSLVKTTSKPVTIQGEQSSALYQFVRYNKKFLLSFALNIFLLGIIIRMNRSRKKGSWNQA